MLTALLLRQVGREKLGFGEWSFSDLSTGDAMSAAAGGRETGRTSPRS